MSDQKYDKIKHLVEVDDDILAVFTVGSGEDMEINNLFIANNTNVTKEYVDKLYAKLQNNIEQENDQSFLGKLKWKIYDYVQLRILILYERSKRIIVLIKPETELHESVDNILGYYYYEDDSVPKSLFR
jgi:hypothetical protein